MKNLFDPVQVKEINERIAKLSPASHRQWGSMGIVQTVAHCTAGLDMAIGTLCPPRAPLPARWIGIVIKPLVFNNDQPMRRNSPSFQELFPPVTGNLAEECARLQARIERFAAGTEAACTHHPHPFFGPLMPEQWAILMYKHLDHHLRQFGA